MIRWLLILTFITGMTSCNFFRQGNEDVEESPVIARVGDRYLHLSQIEKMISPGMSPQDSILLVKSYIDQWALKQILLSKAEMNLPDDKKYIYDKMVDNYKADLYINYYKQALIKQYFDTVFTQQEVKDYYEKNIDMFKSQRLYIRYKLLLFDKDKFKLKDVLKRFKSEDQEDVNFFMEHAIDFSAMQLDENVWSSWEELTTRYPMLKEIKIDQKSPDIIRKEQDSKILLIKIEEKIMPGERKPLVLVSGEVRQMMTHGKKIELLKKIETELLQEAIQNNEYEKYK